MKSIAYTFLIVLFLTNCNEVKKHQYDIKIKLYESYDLIELYPYLIKANQEIRKHQLDSIANISTGIELVDKMNRENASRGNSETNSIENFPLFQVLLLNTTLHSDGKAYIDSSAHIASTLDSIRLRKYLQQTYSVFPNNFNWKITGKLSGRFKCLHAIKFPRKEVNLTNRDIESIIIQPTGMTGLGQVGEKIATINNDAKYWIKLTLKKELYNLLENRTYTLLLNTTTNEYSGSVVNFRKRPNQEIVIGEMDKNDIEIVKELFKDRIIIK